MEPALLLLLKSKENDAGWGTWLAIMPKAACFADPDEGSEQQRSCALAVRV